MNSLYNEIINTLSNYGSIFIYDYSGYGVSNGIPTEKTAYNDIENIWKYLVENKKVNPNKIIVYGQSLGCAISSYLICNLIKKEDENFEGVKKDFPFLSEAGKLSFIAIIVIFIS